MKTLLIALGGNAIIKKGETEDYKTLIKNISETARVLTPIIKNNQTVISFGNGPEIGFILLQNEISKKKVPPMPLDILGAESQGLIGYPLEEQLVNEFKKNKVKREIVTILTQVLVSSKDNAFKNPTKFIGQFYNKKQAIKLKKKFTIKQDSDRGFRRVVPSPKPIKIIESKAIQDLLKNKNIVIAAGGGGIPVVKKGSKLKGVEAVIDKDLASSCLAKSIKADTLIMITDVDQVYLNYKQKNQKALKKIKLNKLKEYYKQNHFPPGSMGPKIEAAINFLSSNGKKVIITNIKNIKSSLAGKAGTTIVN